MSYDSNAWDNSNVVPIRKLAVAMTLDDLERVAREYIDEHFTAGQRLQEEMRLSRFILWLHLHKRRLGLMKETSNV